MNPQLPLGIALRDDASLDNFVAGENLQLLMRLVELVEHPSEASIYLWGIPGTGKSHLLQAVCRLASERGHSSVYIPLAEAGSFVPEILAGLEELDFICIDDLQRISGDAGWEEALFHLFNRARDRGRVWLTSADRSPGVLPVRLADLSSRLAWGTAYQIKALSDEERMALLLDRAARRGLQMSRETALYLIRRLPRDTGELLTLLNRLDRASLAAKRRVTIPFAKEVLGWD